MKLDARRGHVQPLAPQPKAITLRLSKANIALGACHRRLQSPRFRSADSDP